MSRKSARDCAFKLIFEIPFHNGQTPDERILNFYENENPDDINENDKNYISLVVNSCFEKLNEIDSEIEKSLENWKIERLSKVDLSILRLAATEIYSCDDVPFKVSVNEAVELAKIYGEDNSPSFINGVLSKFEA